VGERVNDHEGPHRASDVNINVILIDSDIEVS